jgi:site-specific DNA-methyltransferase (adenine-specific)
MMTTEVISKDQIDNRRYWIDEISKLSGDFGADSEKVEQEISQEIARDGVRTLIGHLRLCGAIPERYAHDSSEEKLYSKYTDVVISKAFEAMGLTSLVLTERADAADVECLAENYSFVAEALNGRLDRRSSMRWSTNSVYAHDSVQALKELPKDSVHLILSDIPYGIGSEEWDVLHNNTNSAYLGKSPAQDRAGAIFGKRGKPINGWSEADREIPRQYYEWCSLWASDWLRVLKPGGSAIVFAGRRLAHRCTAALEDAGFSYKDMLAWMRERAPHRAQRISVVFDRRGDTLSSEKWRGWRVGNLRPTFEPILWFTKPYKIGTTIADNVLKHGVGAYNEAAFLKYTDAPRNVVDCGFAAREAGVHPTQKPISLMKALIELTTKEEQFVLDPFCGSGSSLVAAQISNRQYLGFDLSEEYVDVARSRLAVQSQGVCPFELDDAKVQKVLGHYQEQTEEEATAEDEATFEDRSQPFMEVPNDLVPEIRSLIAKHQTRT